MIYQRMNYWRIIDSLALNFHLVTATVTLVLCTNWQMSLFMSLYVLCTVILCIRASRELYRNGQNMQVKQENQWCKDSSDEGLNLRNNIKSE